MTESSVIWAVVVGVLLWTAFQEHRIRTARKRTADLEKELITLQGYQRHITQAFKSALEQLN